MCKSQCFVTHINQEYLDSAHKGRLVKLTFEKVTHLLTRFIIVLEDHVCSISHSCHIKFHGEDHYGGPELP